MAKIFDAIADRVAAKLIEAGVTRATGNPALGKVAGNVASGTSSSKQATGKKGKAKQLHGSQGWDSSELELLPSKKETVLLDIGLPVAGDIVKATGNILGNNDSLLGAALAAMRIGGGNTLTGETMNNMGLANAAGMTARGMNEKLIGDIGANRIYDTASTLKTEREQARNKAFQINEKAPGLFWQEQRKNAPTASGFNQPTTKSK